MKVWHVTLDSYSEHFCVVAKSKEAGVAQVKANPPSWLAEWAELPGEWEEKDNELILHYRDAYDQQDTFVAQEVEVVE